MVCVTLTCNSLTGQQNCFHGGRMPLANGRFVTICPRPKMRSCWWLVSYQHYRWSTISEKAFRSSVRWIPSSFVTDINHVLVTPATPFLFFSYLFVLNIWRLISVHCCHLHSPSFLPISLLKLKLNVVEYNFLKKTYPLSCLIRKCPFHAMVDSAEHFVVSCRCLSFKNVSIQMVNG